MSNAINPKHYTFSKYEPKDVIREWKLNFNLGNVVKYVCRAGKKGDIIEDLKKARQYLDFEIEALEKEREENQIKTKRAERLNRLNRFFGV